MHRFSIVTGPKTRGFTLIELLVVVTILGVIAMMFYMGFVQQVLKGRDSRRKTDLNAIKLAVEEYEKDFDCYPTPDQMLCDPGTGLVPYTPKIPCDPVTQEDYLYYPDPDHGECPRWFWTFAQLDNPSDISMEEQFCSEGCGPLPDYAIYQYYISSPNAPQPARGEDFEFIPEYSDWWGCRSGTCQRLPCMDDVCTWCSPNFKYDSNCGGFCSTPGYECVR